MREDCAVSRFPLAMFSIGRHFTHDETFLGSITVPSSPRKSSWYDPKKVIAKAAETVVMASKSKASEKTERTEGRDMTVSRERWQRRAFQTKYGVATVLTVNGKKSELED